MMPYVPSSQTAHIIIRYAHLKNNIMKEYILIISIVILSGLQACSQSTFELFSQEGLSIAFENQDDTGQIYEQANYFIRNISVDTVNYFEYQSGLCNTFFYRIEGDKVFETTVASGDGRLLYDFGLNVGDSINRKLFIQPTGIIEFEFAVTEVDTVIFLDGIERKRIHLESNTWTGAELIWINGIGLFNFSRHIVCVRNYDGSVYLDTTEAICNARTSKFSTSLSEEEIELFQFHPNPATSSIEVNLEYAGQISILDYSGRMINYFDFKRGRNNIDISHLNPNVYFMRIESNAGTQIKKLIVK